MAERASESTRHHKANKSFLGIHFRCCNIYQRIYRTADGTAYEGRCPRCGKQARIPIGEGGTDHRFFEAY
jgi:hypothetical protein